jgi:4-aminobutyrate aminotransferase
LLGKINLTIMNEGNSKMEANNSKPVNQKAGIILDRHAQFVPESMGYPSPLVWDSAQGSRITDVDGMTYIDFTSGVLVLNVGHSHPKITAAIVDQAGKFLNCYGSTSEVITTFIEKLSALFPEEMRKILLLTTGSEAIEAAVKISRAATEKHELIAFTGAFHGRTLMTMSLGGMQDIKEGFGPLCSGIIRAYYPYCYRCQYGKTYPDCGIFCFANLEDAVSTQSAGSIAALIIEPYLGAGGAVSPPREYFLRIQEFCRKRQILLVLDEIQASFGRTGSMFAFEQLGIEPDIICLGKGISSGVPMSAVVMKNHLSKYIRSGAFGSTYGGYNPLACAAGLATLAVIEEEKIVESSRRMSSFIMQRLERIRDKHDIVGDVRGMGLSMGVEFVKSSKKPEPAADLAHEVATIAIKDGLAIHPHPGGIHANVLRIMPPLNIDEASADAALNIFENAIVETEQKHTILSKS